ncbi:CLUMA_CG018163, isoform A [Clunio marinus]|uniref:CLUMA_CG018163, isoform A n=1 Tax=Clunio marinus TaxID=568069 RepID=A0A1J1IZD0_9DIPT|nr:CLUMA_CG018163, isoform A [Clunio marinus]
MPRRPRKTRNIAINFSEYKYLPTTYISTRDINNNAKTGNVMKAECEFDYPAEKITMTYYSGHLIFQPKKISVYFKKKLFWNEKILFNTNVKANEDFRITIFFRKIPIDFFDFSDDRIFTFLFEFNALNESLFTTIYEVKLPVLKLNELRYKAPGVTFPNPTVRAMCRQQFKMNEDNSEEEIQKVIILEEFRILPLVERYKAFGYVEMTNLFLDIENSFELDLLGKLTINNSSVYQISVIFYKIDTPGQIPRAASSVCLTPMEALSSGLDSTEIKKLQISCPIVGYHPKYVLVEIKRKAKMIESRIKAKERFRVEFCPNFASSAAAQRSLRSIESNKFKHFFLDFKRISLPMKAKNSKNCDEKFKIVQWMNEKVKSSHSQMQAVINIVNRSSFPSPYIVFGPPGTGKTSTLVEAVAQIVKLQPSAKILITVNSNSACDEVGQRLLAFMGINKLFRFYSPYFSTKMNRVHPKLKCCSNLKRSYHIAPSKQEFESYNVIICTLVTSARLRHMNSSHFDYIFVDECASSAEAFVTIPISNSISNIAYFKALIVLLGDPKQLGQILRTFHSERYGFNLSMMERVMKMKAYEFGDNGYDSNFIVQLTDNFRSHVSILDYSNKQFYNSILKAKQADNIANFAIGWRMLPNPKVPVIFHASWTPSSDENTSKFNTGDISIVINYVRNLLKHGINGKKVSMGDIGIISPYAAQRERLQEIFPSGLEIGTVEYFQGREKLIIILSCVRSKTPTVGFLKNEKRLNVALTRAKALLIVVGNPETLGKNEFWRKFIKLCRDQKATVGKIPNWLWSKDKSPTDTEEDKDEIIRLEEMMNDLGMED